MRNGALCIVIFTLAGCLAYQPISHAKPPLTLDTAPWKTEGSEICARNPKTGLRALIFPPVFGTRTETMPLHAENIQLIFIPGHRLADGSRTSST